MLLRQHQHTLPVKHQACDNRTCGMCCVQVELVGTLTPCHFHCAGKTVCKHVALPFLSVQAQLCDPRTQKALLERRDR